MRTRGLKHFEDGSFAVYTESRSYADARIETLTMRSRSNLLRSRSYADARIETKSHMTARVSSKHRVPMRTRGLKCHSIPCGPYSSASRSYADARIEILQTLRGAFRLNVVLLAECVD